MKLFDSIKQIKNNPRAKMLFGMMFKHRLKLAVAAVCMAVVGGSFGLVAWMIQPIVDGALSGGYDGKNRVWMLVGMPIFVICLYFVRSVALFFQQFLLSYVSQDMIRALRNLIFEKLMFVPLTFFHKEKTGVLMSRVLNDVGSIQKMLMDLVMGPIRDLFTIASLTFVIFYQIWTLAIIAMLVMPIAYFPIVYIGRRIKKLTKKGQVATGELNASLHESFVGIKIVKAFNREAYEIDKFHAANDYLFKLQRKSAKAMALGPSINEVLTGTAIGIILVVGGYYVSKGTYTMGQFGSFLGAVLLLYEPIKRLSKLNNTIQAGLASVERVYEVLDYDSPIKEIAEPVVIERKPHMVRYDHVYFGYDRGLVLKDINLTVKMGEAVAFVGTSGGGKTSLVNLLPRFFDVTEGAIYIDDIDIRNASIASLRDQIAVVTQEPILFNDTVYNNILYGDLNATYDEVMAAAKAAYAYDFVQGFPKGFNTNIGEMGGQISGGQKQRICIARALLKNAPILILDEATSALDTESERLVQMALENLMQGRTTFMIAHRLSTIIHATRILVVVNGMVVEEGSHDELLSLEGEYYALYRKQYNVDKQN